MLTADQAVAVCVFYVLLAVLNPTVVMLWPGFLPTLSLLDAASMKEPVMYV